MTTERYTMVEGINTLIVPTRYGNSRGPLACLTSAGKVRCQAEISDGYFNKSQCSRTSACLEPFHYTSGSGLWTAPATVYHDEEYIPGDVLFGYCRQHSAAVHNEKVNIAQELYKVERREQQRRTDEKNARHDALKELLGAVERFSGVLPAEVASAHQRLLDAGFKVGGRWDLNS